MIAGMILFNRVSMWDVRTDPFRTSLACCVTICSVIICVPTENDALCFEFIPVNHPKESAKGRTTYMDLPNLEGETSGAR